MEIARGTFLNFQLSASGPCSGAVASLESITVCSTIFRHYSIHFRHFKHLKINKVESGNEKTYNR